MKGPSSLSIYIYKSIEDYCISHCDVFFIMKYGVRFFFFFLACSFEGLKLKNLA